MNHGYTSGDSWMQRTLRPIPGLVIQQTTGCSVPLGANSGAIGGFTYRLVGYRASIIEFLIQERFRTSLFYIRNAEADYAGATIHIRHGEPSATQAATMRQAAQQVLGSAARGAPLVAARAVYDAASLAAGAVGDGPRSLATPTMAALRQRYVHANPVYRRFWRLTRGRRIIVDVKAHAGGRGTLGPDEWSSLGVTQIGFHALAQRISAIA